MSAAFVEEWIRDELAMLEGLERTRARHVAARQQSRHRAVVKAHTKAIERLELEIDRLKHDLDAMADDLESRRGDSVPFDMRRTGEFERVDPELSRTAVPANASPWGATVRSDSSQAWQPPMEATSEELRWVLFAAVTVGAFGAAVLILM